MNGQTLRHQVLVTNPEGFHMRPLTAFVQLASRYQSNVKVLRDDRSADGKSAMDMMTQMLSSPGSVLTLEVDGPDAQDCLAALVAMFNAPPEPNGTGETHSGKS